ncbi:uncharacterized protein N7498_006844 [Penicillium cinerascens]|uniref:Major facilitator superfamily (MFS) profile domain-containing protein n=1 Tax=Penicillium cinerascens TaxID=70096 RepID=A0A9W9JKP9_9EURO|nr:uncharacterized protein N7498_006844 [Penicillium cinerascens]KAJ5197727.1 hypothetical protein N7498_006844 [Penicillium cinerascens]
MKNISIGGRVFPTVVWYRHACLRKLYFLIAVIWLSSATGGFDGTMMNGLQTLSYWNDYFDNPRPSTLGLMNAIVPAGNLVINFFMPYMADHWGRKRTLIIGDLILFVGIAIQTGSVNMGMFIASRFIGGVGASFGTGPYLITELAHPQHRAIVTTIYNTFYYIGAIIAAWATYGTLTIQSQWAWRLPSILQFVTPIIQFSLIWFVPESPRFLINRDRPDEARAILEKYHGTASGPEFVQAEFDEICQTIQLEKQFAKRGWMEFFSTKGNRHRFAICLSLGIFANTAGNTILSYYLHQVLDSVGVTSAREQLQINGAVQVYNWVFALGITFFVDKIGRRRLFLISVGGMLCIFIAWTVCSAFYSENQQPGTAKGVLACIFLYYTFYDLAWSGLYQAYACEILPYHLRAKGLAIVVIGAYAAAFFGNYVNPVGLANAGWKYYLLYDCWLVVIFVTIYFLFVESRNTTLEEISVIFDGDDALVGGGVEMSRRERELDELKPSAVHFEQADP